MVYQVTMKHAAGKVSQDHIRNVIRRAHPVGEDINFSYDGERLQYTCGNATAMVEYDSEEIVITPGTSRLAAMTRIGYALVIPGIEILYTAQRDDSAKRLFEITQRMFHNLPEGLRPEVVSDSTHMLQIKQGSQVSTIEIGTAGSPSFGTTK